MFTEPVHSRADRRETTRVKVLTAAATLFRDRGFAATTVRGIAAEAGVSTGTVIAVGDKNTLLVKTFDTWIADLQQQHPPRSSDEPTLPTTDPGKRVAALVQPFIELFAGDQELARTYAAVLVSGNHEPAIFNELADELVREFEEILRDAGITQEHSKTAARVIYHSYLGILFSWAGTTSTVSSALDDVRSAVAAVTFVKGK
ncbi:TetR/AcrR family transcriptional regulator [Spelaeicoccus albus]|uniref:AcrR family transcriptional regulator n=1 Tax=Spelaeicoccus albus TaxID=1280376 RepID=A0A7Z0IH73_9MICO|nr:TetR/AcrR family transcriptional regulator [Spelaeicoccus albus]NYI67578.1 AcrR family transcriptional regulator [Spelaeicoccus albus]